MYKLARFKVSSMTVNGKRLDLRVADNFLTQSVGLMHSTPLKESEGMLFVFGRNGRWGIWMLNMGFSIDIVWLDSYGTVTSIMRDASPCRSMLTCPVHKPESASRYVLELHSGFAKEHGIKIGDRLTIPKLPT
jgi:hypothetical protein